MKLSGWWCSKYWLWKWWGRRSFWHTWHTHQKENASEVCTLFCFFCNDQILKIFKNVIIHSSSLSGNFVICMLTIEWDSLQNPICLRRKTENSVSRSHKPLYIIKSYLSLISRQATTKLLCIFIYLCDIIIFTFPGFYLE